MPSELQNKIYNSSISGGQTCIDTVAKVPNMRASMGHIDCTMRAVVAVLHAAYGAAYLYAQHTTL